ncbi:C4-dicarboxylate ABC transporter substrate-binding protein [Rhizobium sp. KAs_5_22]|uniref:TAXI family TRAP transporter solute-binding subunit n=1 Tax=Ciceribacter selenitireducens TaxID=448181 RepID=UPI000490899A|nr:TAXI family TRAP transporter solute-binding subunit [Ciceribacter selenitireducens]PPJ46636.1 C4-dicarboxylate ABC transporter substrate-binding protein [Rhizobium sp. KAs_5_22]
MPTKLVTFLSALGLALVATTAVADSFERNIMTGGPSGTYIRIGRDIAALGAECGLGLNVVESAGSLENFVGVRNRRNTQFGIVQSDVLEYLKTFEANDPEVQQAVRGVRIMFPLYNEEVHVLARSGVADLKGLAGQKIAIGKADSGTYLTATLMLDILQIKAAERLTINPDEALPKLLSGEIDAFFYVAGAPAPLFANAQIDGTKFHLLPIKDAPLLATYTAATVPAATYSFQQEPVDLVAVKAVLMTYDYDPKKNAYHRESCRSVSDFSSLILNGMPALEAKGHPKWKSVDLTALPPGWQVGTCVKAGMALDYKPACTAPATQPEPAPDANEEYLNLLKQRLKKQP